MKYLKTMRSTAPLLFLIGSIFLITACIERQATTDSKYLLPWPDKEKGGYSLQEIDIPTLKDKKSISGKAAKLYVHPHVINDQLDGEAPKARLAKVDNLYVPQDTVTQELLSVYAHTERLMRFDEALGLKNVLNWPRRVGVQTLGVDSRGRQKIDNAGYSDAIDGTVYYPYQNKSKLALSLNGGVIAHEHFHALFSKLVMNPLRKENSLAFPVGSSLYLKEGVKEEEVLKAKENYFLLRAFNEAFADVWGLIYSEDKKLVVRSLHNSEGFERNYELEKIHSKLREMEPDMQLETSFKGVLSSAYNIGGVLATLAMNRIEEDLKVLKVDDVKKKKILQGEMAVSMVLSLRKILDAKYEKGIRAEDALLAIYGNKVLSDSDCLKLEEVAMQNNPLRKQCDTEREKPFDLQNHLENLEK